MGGFYKMKKVSLLITILMFTLGLNAFAQYNVTIIPFTGGDADDGSTIARFLQRDITNYNKNFNIIQRTAEMRDLARERQYQKSGIIDADTIARMGRSVGANYVITGHIYVIADQRIVVVSMTDVATLRQTAGTYYIYRTISDIKNRLPAISKYLIDHTLRYRNSKAPILAVLPFNIVLKSGTDETEAEVLSQVFIGKIANSGKYIVVQRPELINKIIYDQGIQPNRLATSSDTLRKVSNATGAQYALTAFIPKHGGDTLISAEIMDINTMQQLSRGSVEYRGIKDGAPLMDELTYQVLGSRGRNIADEPNYSETYKALEKRSNQPGVAEMRELLKNGDINEQNEQGWTCLMIASFYGYNDIVRALLKDGADVNISNNDGATSLMWAASEGHADVAKTLIAADADVNARTNSGATALGWTRIYGHTAIINALVKAGAK